MLQSMELIVGLPWAAAIADMLATSIEAEEETPFPSGTAEETYLTRRKKAFKKCISLVTKKINKFTYDR